MIVLAMPTPLVPRVSLAEDRTEPIKGFKSVMVKTMARSGEWNGVVANLTLGKIWLCC